MGDTTLEEKAMAVFGQFDVNGDGMADLQLIREQLASATSTSNPVQIIVSTALDSLTPDINGFISGADFVSAFLLAAEQPAQENSFDTSVSNRSSEVSGVQSTPTLSKDQQRATEEQQKLLEIEREENESLRESNRSLERTLHDTERTTSQLRSELSNARSTIRELEEKEEIIITLQKQIDLLNEKFKEATATIATKDQENRDLGKEIQKIEKQNRDKQKESELLIQSLQTQAKASEKLLDSFKTRTEGVEQQKNEERSDLVGQIDELTNLVSDEKRKRQEAEGNHESLVRDLEIARAEVTTLEEKLAQCEEEKEQFEHIIAEQEDKLAMQTIEHNLAQPLPQPVDEDERLTNGARLTTRTLLEETEQKEEAGCMDSFFFCFAKPS